ncbi:DUF1217 domain-containing protein [Paracoccus limosus]|uniref:DUF1217 domain-containing protein n=1 Tax=Paracoccus limosus TaxID=913252 RepID=A0A844H3P7_9RHOB|nr:DUF1217 domain-containing protein [Paracoccus limosus]MTH32988.1 DUF1217 domain-containing protein [Paracoccus limosus]
MTYNVQLGSGGYLGWKLLQRTADRQRAVFEKDPQIQNSRDYFAQNIASVTEADDLVSNYKLLSVALRAFGLDDDLNNRAFIKKVLEADPSDGKSIVNRLSDKRYLKLNQAFGFGSGAAGDRKKLSIASIADLYVSRSFEKNIGQQHEEIELALNAQRELPGIIARNSSDSTKWYHIAASTPLRKVFEGAFGFPATFARLPVDRQVSEMKTAMSRMFGSPSPAALSKPENMDKVIKSYLIRSQINESAIATPYAAALTILRR